MESSTFWIQALSPRHHDPNFNPETYADGYYGERRWRNKNIPKLTTERELISKYYVKIDDIK